MGQMYFYIILGTIVIGGATGGLTKVFYSIITSKKSLSAGASIVIGIIVAVVTGGMYAINATNKMMGEVASNLDSYHLSYAIGNTSGSAAHFNKLSEQWGSGILTAIGLGICLSAIAVAIACYIKAEKKQDVKSSGQNKTTNN